MEQKLEGDLEPDSLI